MTTLTREVEEEKVRMTGASSVGSMNFNEAEEMGMAQTPQDWVTSVIQSNDKQMYLLYLLVLWLQCLGWLEEDG